MKTPLQRLMSRRGFLGAGLGSAVSLLGASLLGRTAQAQDATPVPVTADTHGDMDMSGDMHNNMMNSMLVGKVNPADNGFDPMQILTDWDYGTVVDTTADGGAVREYNISAGDVEIQIAPGLYFPAWTYNGRVPGPTIRCQEGDHLRINFNNFGTHPHTMHFHGFHTDVMDGIPGVGKGVINPGDSFTYEFDADPFGCHLYHCHAIPLKRHIHKGMYGAYIIDPLQGRAPAREFVMVMNAFDTNFDGGNEIYAVNTVGHEFMHRPIPIKVGETVRIYLINVVEFDLINSFHIHANFFNFYDHGTTLEPTGRTLDTIMMAQGQRGILEMTFRWTGKYMFHAHVSEFSELGWMGFFNVVNPEDYNAALAEVGLDEAWELRSVNGGTYDRAEGS